MGLDIFAGTLTRYYSGNWKTIVQQYGEEQGMQVQIVRPGGEQKTKPDPVQIQSLVEEWRNILSEALKEYLPYPLHWEEDNELDYETDKPDWDCYGAVILWALYQEQYIEPPANFNKDWTNSPIFNKSQEEGYETNYSSITGDCELWLPCKFDFTFRFPDPAGKEIGIASSYSLLNELSGLNEKTWRAGKDTILNWRKEFNLDTILLEEKAKLGFSVLYKLAEFSIENNVPVKLDY